MKLRILLMVALAYGLWCAVAGPVLFKFNPDPGLVRPRSYCVTNPFRNRDPERAAEAYLAKLRAQDEQVLGALTPHYNQRERQYPIRSWRVGDRKDSDGNSWILYWVRRGGSYFEGEEEVTIEVKSQASGWTVGNFNAIY